MDDDLTLIADTLARGGVSAAGLRDKYSSMYKRKFVQLHKAVLLVAERLATAEAQNYPDTASAADDAKQQLLEALFEGAIYSEGVTWYEGPLAYEPASIKYDKWTPINLGKWSHERCAKQNDTYLLDTISVHWKDDTIEYFDSDGEWARRVDSEIRLRCTDIDREFPVREALAEPIVPPSAPVEPPYRTGVAGRPSSRDLARQEMQRRANEGDLCSSLAKETRELCLWLKREHPEAPQPTQKTLENSLRDDYRMLKRSTNLSP
jgi:hypothetical protein